MAKFVEESKTVIKFESGKKVELNPVEYDELVALILDNHVPIYYPSIPYYNPISPYDIIGPGIQPIPTPTPTPFDPYKVTCEGAYIDCNINIVD